VSGGALERKTPPSCRFPNRELASCAIHFTLSPLPLPVVLPHPQIRRTLLRDGGVVVVFSSGSREASDAFREEITLSGVETRAIASTPSLLARISLDPSRQLIAAQCSGTLPLAKLGLLGDVPACTDLTTKPWVEEASPDISPVRRSLRMRGGMGVGQGCSCGRRQVRDGVELSLRTGPPYPRCLSSCRGQHWMGFKGPGPAQR
jgi:hypothetical protein